jgi:4-amino-4-deoxy-L-arabinose transferase-like glycosyltransferase
MPAMDRRLWRRIDHDGLVLLFLIILGLVFFLGHAHLQLASDDMAWLRGEAPTVFDQYRKIPRLFFVSLYALFGPSAAAALVMIFFFHCLNTLLVYVLGKKLLGGGTAALIAAAVFLINPITLSTLTWISCFSYVLGTSLALMALLAFWKANGPDTGRHRLWAALALACFGTGLLCTHEIFFLPFIFLVLGWLQGQPKRGVVLCVSGMALAMLVNIFVYDFGQYGVEASKLLSFDFASAYGSSGLSSGLTLSLAYPLSFSVKTLDFMRLCFAEPVRWGMTVALLSVGIVFYKDNRAWRLNLALAFSFLALITPYIIRLYLMPDTVNYHISYILAGRVFYLPFAAIALALGWFGCQLYRPIQGHRWAWAGWLLPLVAYAHAFWLYDRADFLGLNVVHLNLPPPVPPRWNPYASQHPAWFLLCGLGVFLQWWVVRKVRAEAAGPNTA